MCYLCGAGTGDGKLYNRVGMQVIGLIKELKGRNPCCDCHDMRDVCFC